MRCLIGDRMFNNPPLLVNCCAVPIVGDWYSPAPLLLTVCSFPNPGDLYYQLLLTDFLWFILWIRAFNQLLLINCCFLTCDWKFCAHSYYTFLYSSWVFFFNHTEIIQIGSFLPIFKIPIVKWEPSRYIIANIPLDSDALPCIPNPPILYYYNANESFIPNMYCYIFRIPEILLLTPHSFLADDRTVPNPPSCYC
jgi:hypothetical protein